jgi:hypothetical protein
MLAGGIAIVTGIVGGGHWLVIDAAALIGIGVGASVAPALFVAGYSVRSSLIQRVFALVELLRAVAAFMTAPLIIHLAMTVDGGVKAGMWVCFALTVTGAGLAGTVFLLGGGKLQQPDLDLWQQGEKPAWDSPPLLALPRRMNAAAIEMSRITPLQSEGRRRDARYGEGPDDRSWATDGRRDALHR